MEIKIGTKVLIKSYEALKNSQGVEIGKHGLVYPNGFVLLYNHEIESCGKIKTVSSDTAQYISVQTESGWNHLPKITIEEIVEEVI